MVDDIAELAPGAILLNYTNPMAPLTKVLTRHAKGRIQVAGLCHGVQGTSKAIADYMGLPFEELTFKVSGINHMAWFTEIKHFKKDVYPLLFAAAENPDIFPKDPIRFDLMRNFGYFCTESSKHSYEYVPYYMHDEELKKTHSRTMGTEEQVTQEWLVDMGVAMKEANSMELVRSHEYASGIIEAFTTNEPFMFIGNVINDNLSPDFHNGCCIEVPCLVDRNGIHPSRVDALPPQCAALCRTNINVQELVAYSIEKKDKEAAFHALTLDPTACALLDLKQMRSMFNEIWDAEVAMGLLPN
jgi:alpha-galactosidase